MAYLRKPNWPIRVAVGAIIAAMGSVVVLGALSIRIPGRVDRLSELVQMLDSATNDIVFLGVAIYFLVTLKSRLKRRKVAATRHRVIA